MPGQARGAGGDGRCRDPDQGRKDDDRAGATVRVSFDSGRTWHRAHVSRTRAGQFTASFTAPARAAVTLRIRATDAVGGSITETINDAYRVSLISQEPGWAPRPAEGIPVSNRDLL
jgi:hypothetical protein